MLNASKLRGWMAEVGVSGRTLAKDLQMTEKTFYSKMKAGTFKTGEAAVIKEKTNMSNELAVDIFLSKK